MSVVNVPLRHDRWRPRGIALPIAGGVPDHENPETVIRRAHRAGEARYEPPTWLAAGIDTGLRDRDAGRDAHRLDLL